MSILKNKTSQLLVEALRGENEYQKLWSSLSAYRIRSFRQNPAFATGLSETLPAVLAAALLDDFSALPVENPAGFGVSLALVPDEKNAAYLYGILSRMLDGVYLFPMRDFVFHDVEAFSHDAEHERLEVLRAVENKTAKLVIAVPEAAMSLLPPERTSRAALTLHVGDSCEMQRLFETLLDFGYAECDTVEGKGQFSHRGDIVDIFPPTEEAPLRVEFYGDEIDACGSFDVMSQRRTENVSAFSVTPAREMTLTAAQKEKCLLLIDELIASAKKRNEKAKKSGEKLDTLTTASTLEKLMREREELETGTPANLDKYLPVLSEGGRCLLTATSGMIFAFDYPRVAERIKSSLWQLHETALSLISAGELHPSCAEFMRTQSDLEAALASRPSVITSNFTAQPGIEISGLYGFLAKQSLPLGQRFDVLCEDVAGYNAAGYRTVILTSGEKAASELAAALAEKGIRAVVSTLSELAALRVKGVDGACCYCVGEEEAWHGNAPGGFVLARAAFALITESGAQGGQPSMPRAPHRALRKGTVRSSGQKILSYQDLAVGDYVVHAVHGIARYEGLRAITVDGVTRDYIMLKYAGSDTLYIPVGQLDRISKYASAGETVKLSSMSSKDWQKTKARAKKAAKDMAKQLIRLYAERTKLPGYAFAPDTEWQREFEAGFEYEETDGQLAAVGEIKEDMEKPYPMDRLLCGDVGFGKTEVALRAVFKCVIEGKQAAILVPTTILALQHYQTVLARMKGFPFKIEMLSRFCKPKEAAAIVKRLATGETDIVIGTHKLLGKNIAFHDLGLLVVDEEQRFGVAHKERLKELSRRIDVLTLTATPIPRTLNMAMAGIRDMSVLEEAPSDRYPVQTYVLEYDEFLILEAIKKELRRAGQVFYLHNRVEGIEETAARLREKLPDARIACAHGRMSEEELSDVWASLLSGNTDILVCTTIIETGVDVPNANTLIIEDAERLGLAQLHQIRGRIGRSSRRAYAYITWRRSAALTEIAEKRLEALREFTEFGSGFRIAMRDLEIRGAGNLLGAEQSGHMEAVGYEMYIRILEEAVLEERSALAAENGGADGSEIQKEKPEATIDLRVNAYIPEKYIRLPGGRIEMYKKIAYAKTKAEMDEVRDEMLDRYGTIPKETEALCEVSLLRARSTVCGVKKIEQRENKLIFYPETVEKSTAVSLSLYFKGRLLLAMGREPGYHLKLDRGEDPLRTAALFVEKYETLTLAAQK